MILIAAACGIVAAARAAEADVIAWAICTAMVGIILSAILGVWFFRLYVRESARILTDAVPAATPKYAYEETIFDDIARKCSVPMVAGWSPEDVLAKANHRHGVVIANTLADLARRAGIDPVGLATTVTR